MLPNPYEPPQEDDESFQHSSWPECLRTSRRRIAFGILAIPLLSAVPLRYWAFHYAGSWFVATDIDPEQRRMLLGLSSILLIASITAVSTFIGLLLLFLDNYRRAITGCLLVLAGICLLPALFVFWVMLECYLMYG